MNPPRCLLSEQQGALKLIQPLGVVFLFAGKNVKSVSAMRLIALLYLTYYNTVNGSGNIFTSYNVSTVTVSCGTRNIERANRLVQNKARANTIGFDDVIAATLQKVWYKPIEKGLEGTIRMQTQQQVLHWLMGIDQSTEANALRTLWDSAVESFLEECNLNETSITSSE